MSKILELQKALKKKEKNNKKIKVNQNDRVTFEKGQQKTLKKYKNVNYTVQNSYLDNYSSTDYTGQNRAIMLYLFPEMGPIGGNNTKIKEYASKAYGYECGEGDWPTTEEEDMEALGRLIKQLAIDGKAQGWTTKINGKPIDI